MSEKAAVREVGFTPGPWYAGRPDTVTSVDGYDSMWICSDAGRETRYVAVASGMEAESWAEVVANARLIAVAPEMYEALSNLPLIALEKDWPSEVAAARAALLKARGSGV